MADIRQHVDKAEYRRLLDEVGEDYCEHGRYCIFKEFLIEAHPSRRLLVQLKCVDKFKFERSKRADKDIGWTQAFKEWLEEGFAKTFCEAYSDERHFREIYQMTIRLQAEQNPVATPEKITP